MLARQPVRIEQIVEIGGGSEGTAALKGFGYGRLQSIAQAEELLLLPDDLVLFAVSRQ